MLLQWLSLCFWVLSKFWFRISSSHSTRTCIDRKKINWLIGYRIHKIYLPNNWFLRKIKYSVKGFEHHLVFFFSTFELLRFWPRKKFFIKNCWKNEQFVFPDVFSKPPRKACYISKMTWFTNFTNITCISKRFRKYIRKHKLVIFSTILNENFFSGPKSQQFKSWKKQH